MSEDKTTGAERHPECPDWLRITGPEPNKRGQLVGFDEIVGEGVNIHIERMADSHYWMRIDGPNGQSQRVELWARGGRLYSGTERE